MDSSPLSVSYYDGRSAKGRPAQVSWHGDVLLIETEGQRLSVPVNKVQWPERTRHGVRVAHLPDGGMLRGHDSAIWDDWMSAHGLDASVTVRLQQSWRGVLASLVLLVAVLAAGWQWGVPWAAGHAVQLVPTGVEARVGRVALEAIDSHWMRPSRLPEAEQQRLRQAFADALGRLPADTVPAHELLFRQSTIGPNAFALPGGVLVMTDEMVKLLDGNTEGLVGVLAHELGHVRERHGMRALMQVALVGAISGLVLGDFSSVLAAVPVWLAQSGYSRDAERAADQVAVEVLRGAGLSPAVMAEVFEKLAKHHGGDEDSMLGIALASHPADAERIRFFRDAALLP